MDFFCCFLIAGKFFTFFCNKMSRGFVRKITCQKFFETLDMGLGFFKFFFQAFWSSCDVFKI